MEMHEDLEGLAELESYKILDTLPEKEYSDIAGIASQICNTPISLISFLDGERQFFKAHHGLDLQETPIDQSICLHGVKSKRELFIVRDARKDPRFSDNPLVKGEPNIVFYAGVPLFTPSGNALGALCVIDSKPRKINKTQKESLKALAVQVVKLLELRKKQLELQETKKVLFEEKDRLNNIIEATRVGTFEWNMETDEVRINSRWAEIVGYTLEEIQPVTMDTWYQLVHPDDVAHSDAALKDCFERKIEFYDIEIRMTHKDGHEVWINDRGKVVKWSDGGKPLMMSGTHTDITDRKNTEIQFKTLNDNIPGVVFRYKLYPEGVNELQLVSKGANFLWGVSPESAMEDNQLVWNRFHKDDLDGVFASIGASAENLSFWSYEWRYHHPDGSLRWHKGTGSPKRMKDGSTVWNSIILDITERKMAEVNLGATLTSLKERIKEQQCLYHITRLSNQEKNVDKLLTEAVKVLPSGWRYPEQISAKIEYQGKIYTSSDNAPSELKIDQHFITKEDLPLYISVYYHIPIFKNDEEPFLAEERQLLETVTHNLSIAIDHIEGSKSLEQSNRKIADLIQNIDGIVWEAELKDFKPTFVSQQLKNILGYTPEEWMADKGFWKNHLHPDDREKVISVSESEIKAGRDHRLEYRMLAADGREVWINDLVTLIKEKEKPVALRGLMVDITHLIETQEKLKTSEARYRGFYDSQTNFVIRTDLEGNYSYVNKKFIKDFGWIYPDGEIIGKSCMPSICEHDHQRVIEVVEKCMTNPEKVFKIEIDKPKQGGGTVTTLWDFICMMDGHGNPMEIQCMGIDISDRVKFERALKKSNERYEYVNRATNDAIFDWDMSNDQIEWGEGFYRILGYKEEEAFLKPDDWANLKHPLELESSQEKWEAFMADKNKFRWYEESRIRKSDGDYLETEEIGFLIRDDLGNPVRMIGVLRDISELKKSENQKLIQNELAGIFKEDKGLQQSLKEVLQYLTLFGEYKAAEIWLMGSDKSHLNLTCSFALDESLNSFSNGKESMTKVKKGEGLPGKVWDALEATVWDSLDVHELFLRRKEAEIAGLKSGLGIPILNNDNPVGVIVFLSDQGIDENRKELYLPLGHYLGSEIKRKQQEEEMFLIFQSAPEMLAIASPNGHFVKVNPAFCEILGYDESEIIFQPFAKFLHPDDISGTNKEYAESILVKRRIINYITRCLTKSGEYRWVSWNTSEPFGDEGFVFAYGNDITEMKELQNLHDNATQLARVGSWEIDVPSGKVYLSKISREICRIDEQEELDLASVIAFYRDDVREFVAHTINKAIEWGAGWDFELPLIDGLGNERWVRNIGEAEFREEKCVRLYGSLQDIHNRKILEQKLARKNELLSAISKVIGIFLQTEDWYSALERVFQVTGNVAEVDRVYYFENHVDPETNTQLCSQRYEWCNGQVSPEIDNPNFQNIDVNEFLEFFGPLEKGLPYQIIVSDLPDDLKLKDVLKAQGNKSCLVLPIMMDKKFYGFIGFDDCTNERKWTESEISFLQNISSNLSAAIQRRNSQLSLQKAFDEKEAILESIGEAFFSLDNEWKVLYWNKNAEKLMGMDREEILGVSLWEKFPLTHEMKFYPEYVKAIKNQEPVTFEEFYAPSNIWLEVNASPSEEGISVFFRDITERKLSAEKVRQSNERFEKISEATNDAIWDYDVENNHLFWGKGFKSLFGYDLEKVKPSIDFLLSLIHPEDRKRFGQKLEEYMKNSALTNWFEEYRFLMADGYYAFVMDRAVFIRNPEGKVTRAIGAMTDISYRKEYEESLHALNQQLEQHAKELEISNKELEQFAYVASHDLQEPLRMVSSFMGLLERRYGDVLDEKAHQYIDYAIGGAKRMRKIILDLLEFSRVGKNEDGLQIVELDNVLEEVCLLQRKLIADKKAKISNQGLPTMITYPSPMIQIFQNLIGNALRYSKEGVPPLITVTAEAKDGNWLFAVKDNGLGIAPQYHEKIFIIFQSLHNREKYGGTGMGLAIVKKIVEGLGGKIWVESEEGQGSTFYFTIPKPDIELEVDKKRRYEA